MKIIFSYVGKNLERGNDDPIYFSKFLTSLSTYAMLGSVVALLLSMGFQFPKSIQAFFVILIAIFTFGGIYFLGYYQKVEEIRDKIEGLYYKMFENFVRSLYVLPKSYYEEDLHNLIHDKRLLRRFFRLLRRTKFNPTNKKDFLSFDFTNPNFCDNITYDILVDDIKAFIKQNFREVKKKAQSKTKNKKQVAMDYFGLDYLDGSLIKKAYRNKIKEVHPDVGGSEEEFVKAKELYEYLISLT